MKQKGTLITSDSTDWGAVLGIGLKEVGDTARETHEIVGADDIKNISDYDKARICWVGSQSNGSQYIIAENAINNIDRTAHFSAVARPYSIAFKLFIKAVPSNKEEIKYIKAFGAITNEGTLDASTISSNVQQLNSQMQILLGNGSGSIKEKIEDSFEYKRMGSSEIRKFPDGTMIQTIHYEPAGLVAGAQHKIHDIVYPIAFIEEPFIYITFVNRYEVGTNPNSLGSLDTWYGVQGGSNTNTGFRLTTLENYYNNLARSYYIMAIGRWK